MNKTAQFLIGLISLALAVAAGIYGRNAYLKDVSTIQIPVPVQPISAYTLLKSDLFVLKEVPRAMQSMAYYQQVSDLDGKISTSKLQAGLPVPQGDASPPETFRMAGADYEVLSIPVEPVSAVGGQIHVGQRVNLYTMTDSVPTSQSGDLTAPPTPQVEQIASSILVVDVRSSQGLQADSLEMQNSESSTFSSSQPVEQTQILTLALPPEQVETVLMAVATAKKQGGLLWTSLAKP